MNLQALAPSAPQALRCMEAYNWYSIQFLAFSFYLFTYLLQIFPNVNSLKSFTCNTKIHL